MHPLRLLLLLLALATAADAADPTEFTVGSFAFVRPETWDWVVPTSPMRKAQLSVPAGDGPAPAEVTFFHFGAGQGGVSKRMLIVGSNSFRMAITTPKPSAWGTRRLRL